MENTEQSFESDLHEDVTETFVKSETPSPESSVSPAHKEPQKHVQEIVEEPSCPGRVTINIYKFECLEYLDRFEKSP